MADWTWTKIQFGKSTPLLVQKVSNVSHMTQNVYMMTQIYISTFPGGLINQI